MNVAMVSYKNFAPGEISGWRECTDSRLLLIQNVDQSISSTPLRELENELILLDVVVIYLQINDVDDFMWMATENDLRPIKFIFVMCECYYDDKLEAIESSLISPSRQIIISECGGQEAMARIYWEFLDTGELPR